MPNEINQLKELICKKILSNYKAGEKLESERKLSKILNSTHNKVHRAIQQLVNDGILYTKIGDGTYLNKENCDIYTNSENLNSFSTPFNISPIQSKSTFKKLKIKIPIGESSSQQNLWKNAIDKFRYNFPFLDLEIDFSTTNSENCDIQYCSLHYLRNSIPQLNPLNLNLLKSYGFNKNQFCKNIFNPSTINGKLYGVPTLRIPSVTSINNHVFKKYHFNKDAIHEPKKVFQISTEINNKSNSNILGMHYNGFQWHALNYGFTLKAANNKITGNWNYFENFLTDSKLAINKSHLNIKHDDAIKLFLKNKLAIFSHYLYEDFDFTNDQFSVIPYPIKNKGYAEEGIIIGCITQHCKNIAEAHLFLNFLINEEAQEVFAKTSRNWLTVRPETLNIQKKASPHPSGAIQFEFNQEVFYSLENSIKKLEPEINTEIGKYFINIQNKNHTISKIKEIISH